MDKYILKTGITLILVLYILFSAFPALANLKAFIASDSEGELYQYDYSLLLDSYAVAILGSPNGIYECFIEKTPYALLIKSGNYICYLDILDKYASVVVEGGSFELDNYLISSDVIRANMPSSLKLVNLNSGGLEYTILNLEEEKPDEPKPVPENEGSEDGSDENGSENNPVRNYVMVNVSALNLRSGPGTTYDILDCLLLGTVLEVTGKEKEWLQVIAPSGKNGWVHGDYVKATELKKGNTLKGKVIVIDPGHGGADPGATGYSGLKEKVVTLAVGKNLETLLKEAESTVIMTRTGDQFVSNTKRVEMANEAKADIYVSIHANAFTNPDSNGTETHYCEKNGNSEASRFLANKLQRELVSTLGLRDRGVKKNSFFVLTNTEMPAALVELAFLTNPEEEELLRDAKSHKKSAEAIYRGLESYFMFYR